MVDVILFVVFVIIDGGIGGSEAPMEARGVHSLNFSGVAKLSVNVCLSHSKAQGCGQMWVLHAALPISSGVH